MDTPPLLAATPDEIAETLAYAIKHDERGRPIRTSDGFLSRIAAEHLVKMLDRAGFVMMKKPPLPSHPPRAQQGRE
jgi:hypothetical protein